MQFNPLFPTYQRLELKSQTFYDESGFVNLLPQEHNYIDDEFKPFEASLYNQYPDYQFHSVDIWANESKKITSRYCYDLLNIASDVGGIAALVLGGCALMT
jgi:hypothetical protein